MKRLIRRSFLLASLAALGVISGCAAKKAVVPTAYHHYFAADKSFACDQPDGWEASGAAQGDVESHSVFSSGGAKIHVDSDMASSTTADLQQAANNQAQNSASELGQAAPAAQKPPVQAVHEQKGRELANELNGYKELSTIVCPTKFGDGRLTEYTADDGGKIHGYRLTALGRDRAFTVRCQCPEDEWAGLQPAFKHVIDSFMPGES